MASTKVWQAFREGDDAAYSELYRTYFGVLYMYGLRIHPDQQMVKDSIQDFFLSLYKSRRRLIVPDSIEVYLLKSFRRELLKNISRQQAMKRRENKYMDQYFIATYTLQESTEQNQEVSLQTGIKDILSELSPRQQEIIHLKYYCNFSNQEIGEIVSLDYQTVANHLHRAIKTLRKYKSQIKQMIMTVLTLHFF